MDGLYLPYKLVENYEGDWYGVKLTNNVFEAFGDPTKLGFLLNYFKQFAEENTKAKNRSLD